MNGDIRNDNLAAAGTANIAPGKLAAGSSAQLLVCSSSGVPTYRTITGPVTFSNAGATTIASAMSTLASDTALTSAYANLISVTPAAGTWVLMGVVMFQGVGGGNWESNRQTGTAQLVVGGAGAAEMKCVVGNTTSDHTTLTYIHRAAFSGAETAVLRAKVTNTGQAMSDATRLTYFRVV